ncbi:hypothetical protein [Mycobacterium bourgelatii]|uniref:PDGLE domain-containing protein n=1 Tax=Mycobacterium bourgelatii TaxID=1273442 RepID=A0A7I9YRT1_MYCBU|nr:hypothetical protein [Mycobacterium bourgelatii]MCV6974259.1 hypothetical protein [Mycobacterium bourgelatii]GFG91282.1 hypothetical protein MBOU_33240 [Mycobacterium bourgelatii]
MALLIGIATIGLGVKDLITPIDIAEVTCEERVLPPGDYCLDGGSQFSYEEMRAKETHGPEKSREGIALVAFGSAALVGIGAWGVYRLTRNRRGRK